MAEIEVISVGIQADLKGLKSQLNQAAQMVAVKNFPERYVKVGATLDTASINAAKRNINNQLRGQMERNLEFKAKITASTTSLRGLITAATKSLRTGEGIAIPIKADLKSATALNADITTKIGTVRVGLEWYWKNGPPNVDDIQVGVSGPGGGGGGGGGSKKGGGGAGSPGSSALTPHEKAVNTDAANKVGGALSKAQTQKPASARTATGVSVGAQAAALGTARVPVEGLGRISTLVDKLSRNASKTEGALTNREFLDVGAALKWLNEYIAKEYTATPGGAKKFGRATGPKRGPGNISDKYQSEAGAANVLRKRLTGLLYGSSGTPAAIKAGYSLQLRQLEKTDPDEFHRMVDPYIEERAGKGLGKNPSETKIKNKGVSDLVADIYRSIEGPAISHPAGTKAETGVENYVRRQSEGRARSRKETTLINSLAMTDDERKRKTGIESIQPNTPLLDVLNKGGIQFGAEWQGPILGAKGIGKTSSTFEMRRRQEQERGAAELIGGGPLGSGPTGPTALGGTDAHTRLKSAAPRKLAGGGPVEGGNWDPIKQKIIDFEKYREYNDRKWGKGFTDQAIQKLRLQQGPKLPGRALGGPTTTGMYMVGEKGPEVLEMRGGSGYVHPLPGRDVGGSVGGGYNVRGRAGGYGAPIFSRALDTLSGGDVQRVYVVNMPTGGFGAGQAQGPMRFASEADFIRQNPDLAEKMGILGTKSIKAKAPANETSARLAPSTEEERAASDVEARAASLKARQLSVLQRAGVAGDIAGAAVRSVGPATGQAFATAFGGRGAIIERKAIFESLEREANYYTSRVEKTGRKIGDAQVSLGKAQREGNEEGAAKAQAKIDDLTGALEHYTKASSNATEAATAYSKKVVETSDKFKVFGANLTGIVTGTLLFSTAMGAVQTALGAVVQGGGPLLERATGFTATAARITTQLGDVFRQSGGQTGAIAGAAAQTGISAAAYGRVSPLIVQRSQVEAGNKALVEQIDLIHTAEQLQRQGTVNGYDKGLTQTTGGFLGTALGGVPSTAELFRNEIAAIPSLGAAQANEALRTANAPGGPGVPPGHALIDLRNGPIGPGNMLGEGGVHGNIAAQKSIEAFDAAASLGTERLNAFNDQAEKGGTSLKILQDTTGKNTKAVNDTVKAFKDLNQFELAQKAQESGLYLKGGAISADTLQQYLAGINRGSQTASPELVLQSMQRAIQAQRDELRASSNLQRNRVIPAQFALGELAQPTPGTQGFDFNRGLVGRGDKAAAHVAAIYKTKIGGAISDINKEIDQGKQELMTLVPPDLQSQFKGILDDITATGKQITNISLGVQQAQVNLAVHEYNNQLRLARRSLGDARDIMAALEGHTRNTLGGLEGQNQVLQRQLQLLGFALEQRKINYQVALAGFVAPGSTPGERAARIEEAKIEAAYAQKQLDLQKKIAQNQYTVIHIQAGRDVYDLTRQIALLTEGRTVTINTAAAQRALDILNKKQSLLTQKAGSYLQEGIALQQAAISATAEVERQTGKAFAYLVNQVFQAWGLVGADAAKILSALTGGIPRDLRGQKGRSGHIQAPGYFGTVNTRTNFTVGEAGSETVAILRNARTLTMGSGSATGGGGGVQVGGITIIINGGGAGGSTADLEHWANLLARKVEERLSRKLALLGTRSALGST